MSQFLTIEFVQRDDKGERIEGTFFAVIHLKDVLGFTKIKEKGQYVMIRTDRRASANVSGTITDEITSDCFERVVKKYL